MSGHNTCISCGEYCAEYTMICVNCRAKITETREQIGGHLYLVSGPDDSFELKVRGRSVGLFKSMGEAIRAFLGYGKKDAKSESGTDDREGCSDDGE